MFLTGALYLVFEETIARVSKANVVSSMGSRIIMGVQVCLHNELSLSSVGIVTGSPSDIADYGDPYSWAWFYLPLS